MSLYVLDTDILSLYQLGNAAIRKQVAQRQPDELAVTIITVEEQLSGWYTLRRRVKDRAASLPAFTSGLRTTSDFLPSCKCCRFRRLRSSATINWPE